MCILIKKDFEDVFEKYDVIVGLIILIFVFKIGENMKDLFIMYVNDILMILVNFVGVSGISVLCGLVDGFLFGL